MKIGASILTDDKELLIKQVNDAKVADFMQIDVMDGVFVPTKSVWIDSVSKAIKKAKKPVELHLMIANIDTLIDEFINTKPNSIIFHYEATKNHDEIIQKIKKAKIKAGIALKLETSATVLRNMFNDLDMILVYCTEGIGTQGPKFKVTATRNIAIVREYDKKIDIEVDGGIVPHTARLCRLAGATRAVSGSYLQKNNFSNDALNQLRNA